MRITLFRLGVLLVSGTANASSQQYVHFINHGQDSVVSIESASPGSSDWIPVKIRGVTDGGYVSLQGGYIGSAMGFIDASRGCFYDIRIEFSSRKAMIVKGFDVCHTRSLDIDRAWLKANMAYRSK